MALNIIAKSAPPATFKHSSERSDWQTPTPIIEAARVALGGIDLDPASCASANERVKAAAFYDGSTVELDGLVQPWNGSIFLNAPWGKMKVAGKERSSQAVWTARLVHEWNAGRARACVSVWNAAVCQIWFQPHLAGLICIPKGRIQFIHPETGEPGGSNMYGSVIAYMGDDPDGFADAFRPIGNVMRPA